MNRKLIILIASILLFGTMRAQENHYNVNDIHAFQTHMLVVTQIYLDGVEQSSSDIEIGAFMGNEVRGSGRVGPHTSHNYNRAHINVYYTNTGENIQFKLYDHASNQEYLNYTASIECSTRQDGYGTNKYPVVLSFYTPFTKEITGYGTGTGKWYLIASPLDNATSASDVDNMLSNTYDLYRFNQSADFEWENWKAEGSHNHFTLEPGKGYLYANSGDVTLTFSGEPYSGNGQVTLLKDNDAKFAGWNLVGNPFTQTAYLNRDFYVMNEAGSGIIASEDNIVEAIEGVFVIAETDGETMTFSTEAPQQPGNSPTLVMNITHNRGAAIDRAIIRFGKESLLPKFMLNPDNSKLYIQQNGKDYAIVRAESMGEIPVNFEAEKDGTYTISVSSKDVDFGYLHLIDNKTGADIDLLETPSYTFEALYADYSSRFRLVFNANGPSTGSGTDGSTTFAYYDGSAWSVSNVGEATLQVIDMLGRVFYSETIHGNASMSTDNLSAGIYVMRLVNGEKVMTQKIVVR